MQNALHLKAIVNPGGKIELEDPQLPSGESVEVFVLLPESPTNQRCSAIDILAKAPGHRLFQTAVEVDAYLRMERNAWDH
jgi:hypothetical protein